jgi:hypothetical protein
MPVKQVAMREIKANEMVVRTLPRADCQCPEASRPHLAQPPLYLSNVFCRASRHSIQQSLLTRG